MKTKDKLLGKVSITVEKDYHSLEKEYDKLVIVEEKDTYVTYISRKPVPVGIQLTNREYWIPVGGIKESIVLDYNEFKAEFIAAEAARVLAENERKINEIIRQQQEGLPTDTPSAIGSRWARFKKAEEARDALVEEKIEEKIEDVKEETLQENRNMVNSIMENYAPVEITGDVNNAADEEDLTSVNVEGTDVLKFKDKVYNSLVYSGLGRKMLRKNIVNGVNTLTQDMFYKGEVGSRVPNENTVYIIQYDFTLGENITIPANCVLEFDGGSIDGSNNTITLNDTLISGDARFNSCEFAGTLVNGEVKLSWFVKSMASSTDYSNNSHDAFICAMKLASRKSQGWLNGEKIPVYIEGEVLITENYGNIGLTQLNITFRPLNNYESLFNYVSSLQYRGNYSPITDSIFKCISGISGQPLKDICCIRLQTWYDTYYTYWRDIQATGFTGYFFLNQSYLQEVTFENISIGSGCGFIGFNSNGLYGNTKGTCNILHTLNLNHNNGTIDFADYTTFTNVFDFFNVMELTMVNTVIQGLASGTDKRAISVKCNSLSGGNNRAIVKLDGFWVEYPAGNVENSIFIEENGVYTFTRENIQKVIITNPSVHAALRFEQSNLESLELDIPNDCNYVTVDADTNILGDVTNIDNDMNQLLSKGILRQYHKNGTGWRDQKDFPVDIRYNKHINILKYVIEHLTNWFIHSRVKYGLCNNNGITCLKLWNDFPTNYYIAADLPYLPNYHIGFSQGPVIVRIVYRATILVDVTEENIDTVYFKSGYISGNPGGVKPNIITPKVGDVAGTTEGWKEIVRIIPLNSSDYQWPRTSQIDMRNVKVEFAEYKLGFYGMTIEPDVIIVSPTELKRINQAVETEIYHISDVINSTLEDVIGDAKSIFEYNGNFYRNVNNNVKALFPLVNTTSNRPANPSIGEQFFDKTVGKPIWYNGTAWVDAAGATV